MARWQLANSRDAMVKLVARLIDLGVRGVIFIVPVTLVAYWFDVPPTWKLFAFVGFWSFWSSVVFGAKADSAKPDERPTVTARTVEVMSPAQVAAEARKATRGAHVDGGQAGATTTSPEHP
jgi:hypothetical protein